MESETQYIAEAFDNMCHCPDGVKGCRVIVDYKKNKLSVIVDGSGDNNINVYQNISGTSQRQKTFEEVMDSADVNYFEPVKQIVIFKYVGPESQGPYKTFEEFSEAADLVQFNRDLTIDMVFDTNSGFVVDDFKFAKKYAKEHPGLFIYTLIDTGKSMSSIISGWHIVNRMGYLFAKNKLEDNLVIPF
jgi:hypothetical protein